MNSENTFSPKHIVWVDYARGFAILSVVVWHLFGGLFHSEVQTPDWFEYPLAGWDVFALRLMPLFFLLSGAFASGSLGRGPARFFCDKGRTILYPYVLWTLITLSLGTLLASQTNHGVTLRDLPRIFYDPIMHYWFLYALLVIMAIFAGFYYVRINKWIFFIFSAIFYILSEAFQLVHVSYVLGQLGYFTIFFAIGALIDRERLEKFGLLSSPLLIALAVGTQAFFWAVFLSDSDFLYQQYLRPLTTSAMLVGVLSISVLLDRAHLLRFISTWGRFSLEIYLAHVLFLAGTRIVLSHLLHMENWVLHAVAGGVAGLYGPVLVACLAQHLRLPYIFTFPSLQMRPRASPIS